MSSASSCSVRVVCRFRPVNKRETEEGGAQFSDKLHFSEASVDVVTEAGKKPETYTLDRVFWGSVSQQEVYNYAAKDTIEDIVRGYNGTIFAYGQTGAGKSFTMFGPNIEEEALMGIIPRSCRHIFNYISKRAEGTEFTIKCSFLEIYKEIVRDLLNPKNQNLKVRETPSKGVWVENLTEEFVTCENDIFELLKLGEKFRAVSFTKMNAESSRSHSLFILSLHQKTRDGSTKTGKLNLADLAGSEKVGKTGATGNTLEEAKKINQSLSALGNCINALTKAKRGHVPYRDSKLTHILRESLGGNSKTTLIVACSPHEFNVEETVSTLKFAQRAKTIKNNVKVNAQRSVEELNAIIEKLKRELTMLRSYAAKLEEELKTKMPAGWDANAFRARLLGATNAASAPAEEDGENDDPPSSPASPSASAPSTPAASSRPSTPLSPTGLLSPSASAPGSPAVSAPNSPRANGPLAGLLASLAASGNYDPLMLAELQVDLDRFAESTLEQLNDLKEEVSSLTEKGKRRKEKAKELKEALNTAQDSLRRAKEDGEAASTEMKRLDFVAQQAQLETEMLSANVKSLSSQNQEYAENLKREQEKTSDLTTKLSSTEARATKAESALEAANGANNELRTKSRQLEDSLSALRGEHKLTEVRLEESERERKATSETLTKFREELSATKTSLADSESKVRALSAEKERTDVALEKQKRRADEIERQLQSTTADLKDKTGKLTAAEQLANEQRQRAEKGEAAAARLRASGEESEAEISKLKGEIMKLTAAAQRSELDAKISSERAEQEAARAAAVEARLKDAEEAAAKAAEEAERGGLASSALSELQAKYVGLMKENNDAREKQKEVSRQLGKLQEEAHDKDVEIRRLTHEKEQVDVTVTTAKKRVEELELELTAASDVSKADRATIAALTTELAAKTETLEHLSASVASSDAINTENTLLNSQLDERKAQVERLEADKLERERLLQAETERADSASTAAAAARTALEEAKVSMATQLGDAERRVEWAEQAMQAEKKQRLEAEASLEALRAEIAALEQRIAILKKELSDLQRKYDDAVSKNGISDKQIESAHKRLEEMASEIARKQEANEALKKELKEFQAIHSEVIESLKEQILLLREVERISAEKPRVRIVKPVYEQRSLFNVFGNKEKERAGSSRSPAAPPPASPSPAPSPAQSSQSPAPSPAAGSNGSSNNSPASASDELPNRPPMPTIDDLSSPERDGWLTKQGGFIRNWKKRWFVLKDDMLYYFVDNGKKTVAKGMVDLDGVLAQPAEDIAKRKNTIGLFHDTRRTFFLSTNDRKELDAWYEAINQAATNIYKRRHATRARSVSTVATAPPKITI